MSDPGFPKGINPFTYLDIGKKKARRRNPFPRFNRRMLAGTVDTLSLIVLAPVFDLIAPIDRSIVGDSHIDAADPNANMQMLKLILTDHNFIASWLVNLFVQAFAFFLLSAICWHFWSATPGKMLLRLKIVDEKTQAPISDRQIVLRLFGYVLSSLCCMLGFLWIGIDKKHRAWHDLIAGTLVVSLPWHKAPEGSSPLTEVVP